jgi:hypothetical protein
MPIVICLICRCVYKKSLMSAPIDVHLDTLHSYVYRCALFTPLPRLLLSSPPHSRSRAQLAP